MSAETMENAELGMDETIEVIKNRLGRIRTGKATPALLDGVKVDYYGTPTPLNQLAAIAVPEPRLLTVKPFERAIIQEVQKAIQAANLGLNPSSDGMMIRLQVPELTEDRRKDLAKQAKDIGEDGKVGVRKVRQEANDTLKAEQKDGVITEDDLRRDRDAVQKLTDKFCEEIDRIVTAKSAEIMGM
ncbi:ribosome recycling factor [bacterium CG17_big_fil_post_rev_8_21_14_2_50_64_8]|nr:MAG: ribosome recycling factor [bacterium CG17_big_fil_post_rev_8_21_14_2_50_64_8]PJA73282.1 MAG: ribosome recycling factor [bacterium CG_4_9_14_3_um_filter_65_15]